jgi:hypothetical protein
MSSLLSQAITRVGDSIATLSTAADPTVATRVAELTTSWSTLVQLIAEPPSASMRKCPKCSHLGLSAATRCGYCWLKLVPVA